MSQFRETFDPKEWSAVYDSEEPHGAQFVFRHGSALAAEACLRWSHSGERWVDVGCGTGHLAAALARKELQVTGLDHDSGMIDAARESFGAVPLSGRLRFLLGNAKALPFSEGAVDGLVATSVMGCFTDPDAFYREAFRILRKEGVAILTFTNRSSILLKINGRFRSGAADTYHLYSFPEVLTGLRKIGFEVLEWSYYNFFLNIGKWIIPPLPLSLIVERLGRSTRSSRYLGRNFLVVVRKMA